ncbi:hypothetical protein ACWDUL_20975 [Nocardia niigatensis]
MVVMTLSEDRRANMDATMLWGLAANCTLYEEDPGPSHLNIASHVEPMPVPRKQAWRDFYARRLIAELGGNLARVRAVAEQARAMTPAPEAAGDAEVARTARCCVALSEAAVAILVEAGAETDEAAGARLVASARHMLTMASAGAFNENVARDSGRRLAADLADLDPESPSP